MLPADHDPRRPSVFTVYDLETGDLLASYSTNDPRLIALQIEPGKQSLVAGHWDAAKHIVVDGVVVPRQIQA